MDKNKPKHAKPAGTLLAHLQRQLPGVSRQTLKHMLSDRRILLNDRPAVDLMRELMPADRIRILPRKSKLPAAGKAPSLGSITRIYEDEDLLVIDKPADLLTSTNAREKRPTALAMIRDYVAAANPRARAGLIHRLDRDASGLLVFTKSDAAYRSLKTQFFKHTVERIYEATVSGFINPPDGKIESRLIERADGTVRSTTRHAHGQRAITLYETLRRQGTQTILRVTLLTGRKHQIRVHLSEKGHPIVGDTVYGKSEPGGLKLRAVRLSLDHPRTHKRMDFTCGPA